MSFILATLHLRATASSGGAARAPRCLGGAGAEGRRIPVCRSLLGYEGLVRVIPIEMSNSKTRRQYADSPSLSVGRGLVAMLPLRLVWMESR